MFKYCRVAKIIAVTAILFLAAESCSVTVNTVKQETQNWTNYDTVKARKFDTGKMWTFDYPPVDYFDSTYHFRPSQEWLDEVRMSALKFATWCSASFVSADGLVMTNHHCVDFITKSIQKKGENIKENGFYAKTLADERKVPGVFVDQLVLIQDVSDEIFSAEEKGKTPEEKRALRQKKIKELETSYSEDTGLVCKIIPLYSGGRYSLYGYKRYSDVRMVFVGESRMGLYGGDPDNFTYPRYNPDFSFLRVYDENGEPLHTEHYFKWSKNGPQPNEPIFVVGNPARTSRLRTIAQLKFFRDVSYRNQAFMLQGLKKIYKDMIKKYPEKKRFSDMFFMLANSEKAISGELKGLRNPYLWARKKDFERKFKKAVHSNPELDSKYGYLWNAIAKIQNEKRKYAYFVESVGTMRRGASPSFLGIAKKIILAAKSAPKDSLEKYVDSEIKRIYSQEIFMPYEKKVLKLYADYLKLNLGKDSKYYQILFGNNEGNSAVAYALERSQILSEKDAKALLLKGKDAVLSSSDPFIKFVLATEKQLSDYRKKLSELKDKEQALNDELGKAIYAVYGTSIPPDATFTLRISDGVMKGYKYNGTIAPEFTTFYGVYDRYYSHRKKFPWDLPEEWLNPPEKLDLSTPLDFVSTCDIIGGNSGSPVINKNAEIVGVAFDGNIESLPGFYIYTDEANRTVAVASQGILETVGKIYAAKRLVDELKLGHIPNEYKEQKKEPSTETQEK